MEEQRPWHRLFGLTWMDFFTGQPVTVEMEKDLSLKKQLLDVLLFFVHRDVRSGIFQVLISLPIERRQACGVFLLGHPKLQSLRLGFLP